MTSQRSRKVRRSPDRANLTQTALFVVHPQLCDCFNLQKTGRRWTGGVDTSDRQLFRQMTAIAAARRPPKKSLLDSAGEFWRGLCGRIIAPAAMSTGQSPTRTALRLEIIRRGRLRRRGRLLGRDDNLLRQSTLRRRFFRRFFGSRILSRILDILGNRTALLFDQFAAFPGENNVTPRRQSDRHAAPGRQILRLPFHRCKGSVLRDRFFSAELTKSQRG